MLVWVVSAVGSVLAVGSAMLVGVSCLFSVVLAVGCRGMYGELLCMSFTLVVLLLVFLRCLCVDSA
jgi:hypothetical protein